MSIDPSGAAAPGIGSDSGQQPLGPDCDDVHDPTSIAVVPKAQSPVLPAATALKPTGLHSPPDSNNVDDSSDSELSDFDEDIANADDIRLYSPQLPTATASDAGHSQPSPAPAGADDATAAATAAMPPLAPEQVLTPEQDEDIGEVLPDHWSGSVPVFRPTMDQFKDFKKFMNAVDSYGMKSGIIKIIPPDEWKNSLPPLDDLVKQVRVREPIKQDIMGSNGTYRQVNILHQRSYNVPQWRQLCDQSEHQPPARRGERRANADKPKPVTRTRAAAASAASKSNTASTSNAPPTRRSTRGRRGRGGGRGGTRGRPRKIVKEEDTDVDDRPMTPESPNHAEDAKQDGVVDSIEQDPGVKEEEADCAEQTPTPRRMGGFSRQAKPKVQSTSARRKFSKREGSAMIDEEAFKDFDYKMDISDYTPERCEELERTYWKTLTYATPLYGADLMGTLFHEDTELWNLNKLPNLLDVLGTKVPGVNTAYLYLGMWKATFAWHLEDVDLYSINYLHFGAPKQWYSISQADARRFEAAMKSIWPTDAKACDQFLRHKAFLISPSHLQQHYNIKVNKCLSYPGEFVVTYPYGYHSGYNLGYNCAEAVNFALDSWLPMGKIAKKCDCAQAQDSVWVDVYEIERKLRGEPTPEIWDSDEDEEDEDSDEEDSGDDNETGLPSPRSGHAVRVKISTQKRKRVRTVKEKKEKVKKLRLRVKAHVEPPCCLCPNDVPGFDLLATDDGRKAHRLCALYLPETYIETVDGNEVVFNVSGIEKARLELKCLFCRSKRGACFQCSQKKCPRSYHATCAAAAGVFVEEGDVPVFDKDGVEYKEQAFEFSCRFHRTKRDKHLDGEALEENGRVRKAASALKSGDICQMQFYKKDIFAGIVVENRHDEHTLLLDVLPNGARTEVEWKWLLVPDPADYHLPKASPNALPMPASRKAKEEINAKRSTEEAPRTGDMFVEGSSPGQNYSWAEFHTCQSNQSKNDAQVKLDLSKENQIWHYLGQSSTEAKAQYTEDIHKPHHNVKSNFLDSIPKPPPPPRPQHTHTSYGATHPAQSGQPVLVKAEKPYVYKPRKPVDNWLGIQQFGGQMPPSNAPGLHGVPPLPFGTDPRFAHSGAASVNRATWMASGAQPQVPIQSFQPNMQQVPHHVDSRFTPVPPHPPPPPPFSAPAWQPSPHQQTPHQIPMPSQVQHAPQRYSPSSTAVQHPNGPESQQGCSVQHPVQPLSHPQPSTLPVPPQHTWQKFRYFQSHHNRETSRYRTPYAPWGGFTNGYEGDLRKHLMKKPDAVPFSHNRRLSFNLGGGLQGLTRPPSHSYSNSTSAGTSPRNGAASPTSSTASAMSPPSHPVRGPVHRRTPSVPTPSFHPAMRTQVSSESQLVYNGDLAGQGASFAPKGVTTPQQGCQPIESQRRGSLPTISPAGIPSQQPTFLNTSLPHTPQPCLGGPMPMEVDSETQESPAQQLKQQLRRISDAKESPFRVPGSRSRSHTPRSSLNHLPRLRTPSQPEISLQGIKQERRLSESQATTPMELAANGVAVKEFPITEASAANNLGLVEKLMSDLRRASMQSQGFEGGSMNGLGGFAANP